MKNQNRLTVTTIGTCRLTKPLNRVRKQFPYVLENAKVYGFVHCTKEIIQQLGFLAGELDFPAELDPFIRNEECQLDRSLERPQSQVYLVEVSSLKEVRFRGYYLQINRARGYFADRPQLATIMFKYGKERLLEQRAQALAAEPAFHACTEFEKQVLLETVITMQDYDDIVADLRQILTMFPQLPVFVTHCDVLVKGQPIAQRQQLIAFLRTASQELGFELFEPTQLVEQHGQAVAMANDGQDTAHYSTEFEPIIGAELYHRFIEPKLAEIEPEAPRARAPESAVA